MLAWRKLIRSACDISDGGMAVALAQAAFAKGIGATVEQDPSLLAHPLFGLFAEPASTLIVTADPKDLSEIDAMAGQYNFFSARIGDHRRPSARNHRRRRDLHLRPARRIAHALGLGPGSQSPRRGSGMTRLLFQGVEGVADRI